MTWANYVKYKTKNFSMCRNRHYKPLAIFSNQVVFDNGSMERNSQHTIKRIEEIEFHFYLSKNAGTIDRISFLFIKDKDYCNCSNYHILGAQPRILHWQRKWYLMTSSCFDLNKHSISLVIDLPKKNKNSLVIEIEFALSS